MYQRSMSSYVKKSQQTANKRRYGCRGLNGVGGGALSPTWKFSHFFAEQVSWSRVYCRSPGFGDEAGGVVPGVSIGDDGGSIIVPLRSSGGSFL
jgi:hypothetical protein